MDFLAWNASGQKQCKRIATARRTSLRTVKHIHATVRLTLPTRVDGEDPAPSLGSIDSVKFPRRTNGLAFARNGSCPDASCIRHRARGIRGGVTAMSVWQSCWPPRDTTKGTAVSLAETHRRVESRVFNCVLSDFLEANCVAVKLTSVHGDAEEMDLVVHISVGDGDVGVVNAGYGLVWAKAGCIPAWHRLDDDIVMSERDGRTRRRNGLDATDLCARTLDEIPIEMQPLANGIVMLLSLSATATLHTLILNRAVLLCDDLTRMLAHYLQLRVPALDSSVVETLDPLVDAYRRTTPPSIRLAELAMIDTCDLRGRRELVSSNWYLDRRLGNASLPSFVDALARGAAPGGLHELHLAVGVLSSDVATERVVIERHAEALATSSLTLTRLHVSTRPELQASCVELSGSLDDHPLSCTVCGAQRAA